VRGETELRQHKAAEAFGEGKTPVRDTSFVPAYDLRTLRQRATLSKAADEANAEVAKLSPAAEQLKKTAARFTPGDGTEQGLIDK